MPQMPKDVSFPTAMLAAEMISFSLAATTGLQQRINFLYNATFLEGSQTSSTCPQLLRHKAEVSLMLVFMTLLMGTMSLAQVGRAANCRIWGHSFLVRLVSDNSYMHFLSCGMGSPVAAQYWRRCDRLRQCSDSLRRLVVHQGAAEIGRFCSHGSSSEWWEVLQVGAGAK